jgi:FKBP-type peptidyl-prolyl cis-trans isomerase FkpA
MTTFKRLILFTGVLAASTIALARDPGDDLQEEKRRSAEYLAKMAAEPAAEVLEQGVVLRPIFVNGAGELPTVESTVKVTYHLADREGKLIEESLTADALVEFPLKRLIACWQLAFPKIRTGSLYKLTCPSDTAYGDHGHPPEIKGGAALTFRVSLYGIVGADRNQREEVVATGRAAEATGRAGCGL